MKKLAVIVVILLSIAAGLKPVAVDPFEEIVKTQTRLIYQYEKQIQSIETVIKSKKQLNISFASEQIRLNILNSNRNVIISNRLNSIAKRDLNYNKTNILVKKIEIPQIKYDINGLAVTTLTK